MHCCRQRDKACMWMFHAILFIRYRVIVLHFMNDIIVSKSCFIPIFNIVLISHRKCEHVRLLVSKQQIYPSHIKRASEIILLLRDTAKVLLGRKAQTHLHAVTSANIYITCDLAQKQQLYETHDLWP